MKITDNHIVNEYISYKNRNANPKKISINCGALPLALATDEVQGGGDKGGPVKCKVFLQLQSLRCDSDNAKIMFQSRTHNLEFQLIGEKSENSNIYVVYMQFFYSRQKLEFSSFS